MKFKSMISDWLLENALASGTPFTEHQYSHFLDVFGKEEIGFVSLSDVIKESVTKKKARVFKLDSSCRFYLSDEEGLSSNLFSAEDFDFTKYRFIKFNELRGLFDYLESLEKKGDIGLVFNSKEATLLEDKKSFVDFYNKGFNVVESHFFDNLDSLSEFIKGDGGKYLLKHRFGLEGRGIYRINPENVSSLDKLELSDYIVQPELNILSEKRFIYFKDELLGSRIIFDRTMPWEKEGVRRHETYTYIPRGDEVEATKYFFNHTGALLGCIDTIQLGDGREIILEYNGAATGLGYPEGPYDCNRAVAERLSALI